MTHPSLTSGQVSKAQWSRQSLQTAAPTTQSVPDTLIVSLWFEPFSTLKCVSSGFSQIVLPFETQFFYVMGLFLGPFQWEGSELKENRNSLVLINVRGQEGGWDLKGGRNQMVILRFRVWVSGIHAFLL